MLILFPHFLCAVIQVPDIRPTKAFIRANFCFNGGDDTFFKNNIRALPDGDPAGALGDLGHYCMRFALICQHMIQPPSMSLATSTVSDSTQTAGPLAVNKIVNHVRARCHCWSNGVGSVPLDCDGHIEFSSGLVLSFEASFIKPWQQEVQVRIVSQVSDQSDAVISMTDYAIPFVPEKASYEVTRFPSTGPLTDFSTRTICSKDTHTTHGCCQERAMFEKFAQLVTAGQQKCNEAAERVEDSWLYWRNIMLCSQQLQDLCFQSMLADGAQVTQK